jgi:CRISPR-associated exonuclease Cas4
MPDYSESEIVLVSAIEHYSYCPRQCALIHVEKVFDENIITLRGRHAHERVDEEPSGDEDGVRVERGLPIWSDELGLYGKADVVEFRQDGSVYPVEYKHGPRRAEEHDDVQLCAQALCLEDMLGVSMPLGAVYHHTSKRRREVEFDEGLRLRTRGIIDEVRETQRTGILPPPVNDSRCPNCSLVEVCMPSAVVALQDMAIEHDLFRPVELEGLE